MTAHHLYAHKPTQKPEAGVWLLSIPRGSLALWLPLAQELLRPHLRDTMLISAIDQPPSDAVQSAL